MMADVFYSVDIDGMNGVVEVKGQPCGPGQPIAPLIFNLHHPLDLQYPWPTPPKVDRVRIVWLGIHRKTAPNRLSGPEFFERDRATHLLSSISGQESLGRGEVLRPTLTVWKLQPGWFAK